ncbi:hypothetical protein FOA52_005316 [Chlamydomonas sp. UWO 241]|nr:hypothetical protein FOA52_005316 [Chlamydomonas sp. UWO 241]
MRHRCDYGQHLAIVGGHAVLGAWEPSKGVSLTWTDGDEWVGEAIIGSGDHLEYKYVVRSADGTLCYWKEGANVVIDAPRAPGARVLVQESWLNQASRRIEILVREVVGEAAAMQQAVAMQQAAAAQQASMQQAVQQQAAAKEQAAAMQAAAAAQQAAAAATAAAAAQQQQATAAAAAVVQQQQAVQQQQQQAAEAAAALMVAAAKMPAADPLQGVADAAMSDLREAMAIHEDIQRLSADPNAREVLQADRLLAAASNKAVAMGRALKAAQDFPQLPGK